MGAAPAGTPASGCICRWLGCKGNLPMGIVPAGTAPAGDCLRSLAPLPQVSRGLAAGWSWLAALAGCPSHSQQPPCRGPRSKSTALLLVARSWLGTPARGLTVANHPCRWLGHGRLSPCLAVFTVKNSTRIRILKLIFHTKTLALIPLFGNLSGSITCAVEIKTKISF
ncbi:hypothetical protein GW17_00053279 [Ensete ventricosum]|nr:hypothetical protein GW17_00053279 [Ensete ventricosum]RZS15328.1 hypothetical protein BHM03_00047138 [Ensete ventricosum]